MESGRPAGLMIRAVAALVDFAVFFLVRLSFGALAARVAAPHVEEAPGLLPLVWTFTLIFTLAYSSVLPAWAGGQTIGKMLVGIRVVAAAGTPVGLGPAVLRYCGYYASLGTLGLGFAMAGLRADRRALHDLIAGTSVEWLGSETRPVPPAGEPRASEPVAPAAASPGLS